MALHLQSCEPAGPCLSEAAPEMLSTLREARLYVGADLASLLRTFCVLKNGEPQIETLDSEAALAVAEARRLHNRISIAIAKATGAAP